jgi:hypothetical protein
MSMVAETLRLVAAHLPRVRADEGNSADGYGRAKSPYICDTLGVARGAWIDNEYAPDWNQADIGPTWQHEAHSFLVDLGMGTGKTVFSRHDPRALTDAEYADAQERRVAWLIFAADLAKEWDV